jgi:hypothetical protein
VNELYRGSAPCRKDWGLRRVLCQPRRVVDTLRLVKLFQCATTQVCLRRSCILRAEPLASWREVITRECEGRG